MIEGLIGSTEVARLAGVTRADFHQLRYRFPDELIPAVEKARGLFWTPETVEIVKQIRKRIRPYIRRK